MISELEHGSDFTVNAVVMSMAGTTNHLMDFISLKFKLLPKNKSEITSDQFLHSHQ